MQEWNLAVFLKQIKYRNNEFTFVSSESFNTYVNLFSFRGRLELFVLPALPTRCIADTITMHKSHRINSIPRSELKKTIPIKELYLGAFPTTLKYNIKKNFRWCSLWIMTIYLMRKHTVQKSSLDGSVSRARLKTSKHFHFHRSHAQKRLRHNHMA